MDGHWLGDDALHIFVVMSPFSQLISQISLFFVHILFCLRLVAPSTQSVAALLCAITCARSI